MHVLEPFLIDLNLTPDHNSSDIKAEIDALFLVQRITEQFLKGNVSIDVLDDCLAQFGVNPNEYWGIVEENVDAVIEQNTAPEHSFILIPS